MTINIYRCRCQSTNALIWHVHDMAYARYSQTLRRSSVGAVLERCTSITVGRIHILQNNRYRGSWLSRIKPRWDFSSPVENNFGIMIWDLGFQITLAHIPTAASPTDIVIIAQMVVDCNSSQPMKTERMIQGQPDALAFRSKWPPRISSHIAFPFIILLFFLSALVESVPAPVVSVIRFRRDCRRSLSILQHLFPLILF